MVAAFTVVALTLGAAPARAVYLFKRSWITFGTFNGNRPAGPADVAVDRTSGNVYVPVNDGDWFYAFSATGQRLHGLVDSGLSGPNGAAVAPDGTVFFTFDSGQVLRTQPNVGNEIKKWGAGSPNRVTVDQNGVVYVADGDHVDVFDEHGNGLGQFGGGGTQIGEFDSPVGLAVLPDGAGTRPFVYVSDRHAASIRIFAGYPRLGRYQGGWPVYDRSGHLHSPGAIAVGPHDDVYVVIGSRIYMYSRWGRLEGTFGGQGIGPGKFNGRPTGIALDAAGDAYVSDFGNDRIEEFQAVYPSSTLLKVPCGRLVLPGAVCTTRSRAAHFKIRGFERLSSKAYVKTKITLDCKIDSHPWQRCSSKKHVGWYRNLSDGLHTLQTRATDAQGLRQLVPTTFTWQVDHTPPKVFPPTVDLASVSLSGDPVLATATKVPVKVTWFGYDLITPAGILRWQLEQRSSTASGWGAWHKADTPPVLPHRGGSGIVSVEALLTPSRTVSREFRVGATDSVGNTAWSTPSDPVRAFVVQDDSARVKYTGPWVNYTHAQAPQASGTTIAYADTGGATATLSFKGTSVALIGANDPVFGTWRVCLDPGTPKSSCSTVSHSSAHEDRVLLFAQNALSKHGSHTIRITDKSGLVNVDAFLVLAPG